MSTNMKETGANLLRRTQVKQEPDPASVTSCCVSLLTGESSPLIDIKFITGHCALLQTSFHQPTSSAYWVKWRGRSPPTSEHASEVEVKVSEVRTRRESHQPSGGLLVYDTVRTYSPG